MAGKAAELGVEIVQAARPKRIDAGVAPDVRARPTVLAQFNVVAVRGRADAESGNQLVLAAIEAALGPQARIARKPRPRGASPRSG